MPRTSRNRTHHAVLNTAVAVLYAGGEGTRLWPLSTAEKPKQINPAFSKSTLVVEAYRRARELFPVERILVVLTKPLYKKVVRLIHVPRENILVQPANADTATAMGFAALFVETYFPESVAVTYYTDQLIRHSHAYTEAVRRAIRIARERQAFLTIGTEPTLPNPSLGYVKLGKRLAGYSHLFSAAGFVEKPSSSRAKRMLASKEYVWNTGIYVWHVRTLLRVFKEIAPDLYQELLALRADIGAPRFAESVRNWYDRAEKASFDRAISEKTRRLWVLVARFNWRDVGTWNTIYELSKKDRNGNVVFQGRRSRVLAVNATHCFVRPQQHISLVGVTDLIIVQTPQELLICKRDQAPEVKKVVELMRKNHPSAHAIELSHI
jgi:mannose-1-phosphate guanylyltransferase